MSRLRLVRSVHAPIGRPKSRWGTVNIAAAPPSATAEPVSGRGGGPVGLPGAGGCGAGAEPRPARRPPGVEERPAPLAVLPPRPARGPGGRGGGGRGGGAGAGGRGPEGGGGARKRGEQT